MKLLGIDDMVLLPKVTDEGIVDNLRKRFLSDCIYTYIGPVLISVNPFKELSFYTEKEIEKYQGCAPYENPPHIFALADDMYRNMLIDLEKQCVIISGESGAGKTVAARYLMQYITKVSGGGLKVQHIKDIILESNPLLEAFGNAKTIRNNNSSRFGKYIEIDFTRAGEPSGGEISNFLLEKSRVVLQNPCERNFHIFYQLCKGATEEMRNEFGLTDVSYYYYLNQTGTYDIDGTDDVLDFQETLRAMDVMGFKPETKNSILSVVSGILHMGNIQFCENGNYADISGEEYLQYPAYLLEIDPKDLKQKLISRVLDSKWGGKSESITVTLNLEQAVYARDAWTKSLYARLFDFIVKSINKALGCKCLDQSVGILDIYGFEIFQNNGFEQFCINYVNEKLQQIFIELTLKAEQEEYKVEGISWAPIEYFNNKIVCELIESKRPPGIMSVVDDVCATMHGGSQGADSDLLKRLNNSCGKHEHFQSSASGFIIHHYAGKVSYNVDGFSDRNRDVLFPDIVAVMLNSESEFVKDLFVQDPDPKSNPVKSRPSTASNKIRTQANELVKKLMLCNPHYIRCIKPNENKKALDWEHNRVLHQVEYLGLKENIRVRRAGFAYRRPFLKFLQRYSLLCKETWPTHNGTPQEAIKKILKVVQIDDNQYQIGKSKIFIRNPESLFLLEESRERKYDYYARVIQKAFKKNFSSKLFDEKKMQASDLLFGKKERRKYSLNRYFYGDYIGLDFRPQIRTLIGKKESVEFAETVKKYDRWFKVSLRDLIVTNKFIYMIGREIVKQNNKKEFTHVIKRKILFTQLSHLTLSTLQDDYIIIHVLNDYDSLIEVTFKSELLTVLSQQYKVNASKDLNIQFSNIMEFKIKKGAFTGGITRCVKIERGSGEQCSTKVALKTMTVYVGKGLPSNCRPGARQPLDENTVQLSINVCQNVFGNQQKGKHKFGNRQLDQKLVSDSQIPIPKPPRGLNVNKHNHTITSNMVPPPPSDPPPYHQPKINLNHRNSFAKHPHLPKSGAQHLAKAESKESLYMNTLDPGISGKRRANIQKSSKPIPAGGRAKPKPKPRIVHPTCKALYNYDAQDTDEISFVAGDIIQIVFEDPSGWWKGILRGREGLFPGNHTEKL